MSAIPNRLVIATRQSRLALWQAEHVRQVLQARHRTCKVELLGLSTRGDEEVIAAANERDVAMVFTGVRHFRH